MVIRKRLTNIGEKSPLELFVKAQGGTLCPGLQQHENEFLVAAECDFVKTGYSQEILGPESTVTQKIPFALMGRKGNIGQPLGADVVAIDGIRFSAIICFCGNSMDSHIGLANTVAIMIVMIGFAREDVAIHTTIVPIAMNLGFPGESTEKWGSCKERIHPPEGFLFY